MPFINISTSAKVQEKKILLEQISLLLSSLTNKSQKFVMVKLEDNLQMHFEDDMPCCYLEIKSIGSLKTIDITKPICDFVCEKIGIPVDRIYISFEDVPANMWGWNGKTFG